MPHTEAILRVAIICAAFFLLHSLLVARRVKRAISNITGRRWMQRWYRFCYTAISVLSLPLALWLLWLVPDTRIYSAPGWLAWPMHGVQLFGLAVGVLAYGELDSGRFTGRTQAAGALADKEPTGDLEGMVESGLVTGGAYAVVRNPLYFAGITVFAFEPNLTRTWLTVSVMSVGYFLWGAWIEQRRMVERFGPEYRQYMQRVPLLMARPRPLLAWLRHRLSK